MHKHEYTPLPLACPHLLTSPPSRSTAGPPTVPPHRRASPSRGLSSEQRRKSSDLDASISGWHYPRSRLVSPLPIWERCACCPPLPPTALRLPPMPQPLEGGARARRLRDREGCPVGDGVSELAACSRDGAGVHLLRGTLPHGVLFVSAVCTVVCERTGGGGCFPCKSRRVAGGGYSLFCMVVVVWR